MGSKCVKEKEHEHSIENHRLACSEETEAKQKLECIARENGHNEEAKSAYNEQEMQLIDKRLSNFTERQKNRRRAKKTDKRINTETQPDEILDVRYRRTRICNRNFSWDAKEAEDNFPTFPHLQVISPYNPPPAPPPPDLLDDLNPDNQQQQHTYTTPEYENHNPHFLVDSAFIPPSAPFPQDLLNDFNPGSQQQLIYYTPSDIENDVSENLPPNSILSQHENPAPPPPDYLE